MQFPIFALVCCLFIGAVLGQFNLNPNPSENERWEAHGGHNHDQTGHDVHVEARVPVWTSDNKRHEVDIQGRYAQHLGGPWGNSPSSWDVMPVYRFRF